MITTKLALLSFAMAINIGVIGASAQHRAATKHQESGSSPSAQHKSRPRLAVASPSNKSTQAPAGEINLRAESERANEGSVKPPGSTSSAEHPIQRANTPSVTALNNSENAEAETQAELSDTAGSDSNASTSIRDQIEATPDGRERLRLRLKLAEQLSANGQNEEATAELHAIAKSELFEPQVFYNVGNALARLGDSDGAINTYRKAIGQRKGRYSRALNNLGVVLFRTGRWDEAQDALLKALNLENFHYAEVSYNLGRVYSARGERDLAIREWRRALRVEPDHQAAARALVDIEEEFVIKTEPSSKPQSYTKTTNGGPWNPYGNTAAAKNIESNSAARNPKAPILVLDPVSYNFLQRARDLRETGKLQEAVQNYRRVIARHGGYFAPANLELTYILLNQKKNDEALFSLLKIINRDGARYPISYYYVARLYEAKGDLQLAEESFVKAAMAYKTSKPSILLDLNRVREKRGDLKGGLAALEEYAAIMKEKDRIPAWLEEALAVLRRKVSGGKD